MLLLRDPQLIKQIFIKDFDHFVNRRNIIQTTGENLTTRSLVLMENDEWRNMRTTLSPAFTGRKMRQMFELTVPIIEQAMADVKAESNNDAKEINVKELTSRLTMDMIASTAFGLQINSLKDKNNEFYKRASNVMNASFLQQMKMLFVLLLPKVADVSMFICVKKLYDTIKWRSASIKFD